MTPRPQLSLVFPAFDEEPNFGPLRDRALALAAAWGAPVSGLFGLRVRDIDCAFLSGAAG